ncbi:bifunctional RNase H/acid phosphatase [Serinicoccus kebangsaanensis]|uniref:bifunctional RNase H/acid phosphatase n=1 Tax=Serinicoccus kebangsaanensis TaxID=2602069 RepID=UPI00178C6017|nr:bifunctional RNase H/acid phosphatase [Serinicoccus kebangsaanensis]
MTPRALVVEADGGSRGNPGVAGYGALVRDARTGELLAERAAPLGKASNNVAEYTGLIEGLRAVLELDLATDASVEVRMDSKLVVEQMAGRWKIKHEDMRRLALDARRLVQDIQSRGGAVDFTWIPRGENAAADALSNDGMDGHTVRRDHTGAPGVAGSTDDAAEDARTEAYISDETVPVLEGPTRLVLVRHGVTDFTVQHRMDGRGGADPSLNDDGVRQAEAAAGAVRALLSRSDGGTPRVVSSSLSRARQTGEAVAAALGVRREEDRDWDEQSFGDWDGRAMPALAAREPDDVARLRSDLDFARPGGESRRELDERVAQALDRALEPGGTVVVATHRVAIMSVLCRVLGVDHERGWSIATGPASLTAVEFWPDGGVQVAFVNDTQHLHDLRRTDP